ncbi:MAG: hypothetical protein EBR82_41075 [Caulobacteraceae bacterium]|nr:hypothetical protein [Caulobacteraceae bacterium]NDD04065.1 hypothetical protein [Pseudomonadota bacterium]NDG19422.1 hypothetical protein [Betaproteobacteria bacterium]
MDTIVFGTPQPPTFRITPYRSLIRVTPPASLPVTLDEAKAQVRVDTTADDAYISALIGMATNYVEDVLEISLLSQEWQASYDLFPVWAIILPRSPMASGPVTVTYRLGDGTTQTLTNANNDFQWDYNIVPGRIYPNWASTWPATRGDENSVVVRYPTGYGATAASVPPQAKFLILMLVAHLYENREPTASGTVTSVPYTFDTLLAASGLGVYR